MRRLARLLPVALLLIPAAARADDAAAAPDAAEGAAAPAGPLAAYVSKADDSYRWVKRREGQIGDTTYAELILTSQTWKDIPWKHQLYVLRPKDVANGAQGVLVIAGGRWRPEYEDPPRGNVRLPREAQLLALAAADMKSPVAVLLQVPQQPIFEGKVEDQIISYTFQRYLETGDDEWPLLLPMVKSAVRAMDAVQEFGRDQWKLDIKRFTVTGASKRGWTTWLTGAADARASAIAPMVIDVLNMPAQMKHQIAAWGRYSEQIEDYTRRGIPQRTDTPEGHKLNAIVDPYAYLARIKQPKLLLIGTNDRYWPLDALNLYWNDMAGPKYVTYVPNNGHGLNDLPRVVGTISALHRAAAGEIELPKLDWDLQAGGTKLALRLASDVAPQAVRAWIATSPTRDFREARWRAEVLEAGEDGYRYTADFPGEGYLALFGEAMYRGGTLPYFLSTNVKIVEGNGGEK